jgi:prepilin-type N-terminal cleavage/methylation domain-containing protein
MTIHRPRRAFTLLELVVALVVLGILSALAVPTYLTVISNSKMAVATSTAVSAATDAVAIAAIEEQPVTASSLSIAAVETVGAVSIVSTTPSSGVLSSADLSVVNGKYTNCISVSFSGVVNAPPVATGTC